MVAASVIVPAFNAAATVGDTLDALAEQDLEGDYEVIVVDDGSEDETVEIAQRARGEVKVLRQDRRGPGPARNLAASEARGAVLAFTDADCTPTPGWLREGISALDGADLVQGAVRPDPRAVRRPFDRTVWVTGEGGLYECASLFVGRELFESLGGFDDWLAARIGKPLAEDVWFGWRARRAGARTAFCERALVHHAVFPRSARDYVAERVRLVYFPAIARQVPELRHQMFFGRLFLTRRSAAFDAALGGAAVATVASSLVPLAGAAPYAWMVGRRAAGWRRHAPRVAVVEVLADAVGFAALGWGSIRRRSLVL